MHTVYSFHLVRLKFMANVKVSKRQMNRQAIRQKGQKYVPVIRSGCIKWYTLESCTCIYYKGRSYKIVDAAYLVYVYITKYGLIKLLMLHIWFICLLFYKLTLKGGTTFPSCLRNISAAVWVALSSRYPMENIPHVIAGPPGVTWNN